jgi:hypothetical protein
VMLTIEVHPRKLLRNGVRRRSQSIVGAGTQLAVGWDRQRTASAPAGVSTNRPRVER